ncbi:MAG: sugar ABC transporter permease [Lachnospiraceae bacterium]|nr:sugar ABC transporter permease [Lachnospiraceae bacterium]
MKRKKSKEFANPYSVSNAFRNGDTLTRLSAVIMGLGNLAHKQIIKGLIFLAIEIAYIVFMATKGIELLLDFIRLGGEEEIEIYNESLGIYQYQPGDNSLLMLLYGVVAIFVTIGFVVVWRASIKSAYKTQCYIEKGKKPLSFRDDIRGLFDQNLHQLLLSLPLAGILIFTILPLVFMIAMAFTNYSKIDNHLTLFDWVGLKNFATVLNFKDSIGGTFWSVLGWTLVWAVAATFSNYFLGMILAMIINRKGTKLKSLWRFMFMLSVAVPQFVSLLLMRTMFSQNGIVNNLLIKYGLIENALPFWSDASWARVMVIIINLWIGIPFTILQITGILQNIPADLYEAARVDGAGPVTIFFKITLPYMLFVTSPYLITTFTNNVNNFNVIYLLSGGAPTPVGSTAGKTDLLVTWLYKLTIDNQYYNVGAVIGIMTFAVLAVVSLITYHRTGSYKNEEGFQ